MTNIEKTIKELKEALEEPVSIDFEKELYKAFGQIKDFTLGMRISKWFYDMGKNSQEPTSEVWHDMSESVENGRNIIIIDPAGFYGAVLRKGGSQLKNHNKERYVKWAYIDDLQNLSNVQRTVKNSQEPVSEDLEEAVNTYIGYPPEVDECSSVYGKRQAFKAGAEWQKQQDSIPSKDLAELIDTLSKRYPEVSFAKLSRIAVRVAKWKEQRLMAKAIDGDITFDYYGDNDKTYGCIAHDSFCLEDFGLKDTDKVKVILIKEV